MRSCDRQEEGGRDSIVPRTERRRSTSAGEGMTPAWTPEKISRQVLKSFWTKVGIAGEFFCRLRFLFSDGPLTFSAAANSHAFRSAKSPSTLMKG